MRRSEEPGYEKTVKFHAPASAKTDERLRIFINMSDNGALIASVNTRK